MLTNTVLHATKIPVQAWVGTVFGLCSDPNGLSARDIADRWGVTEKSAWAMLTRIQDALCRSDAMGTLFAPNGPLWVELEPAEFAVIDPIDGDELAAVRRVASDAAALGQREGDIQREPIAAATPPANALAKAAQGPDPSSSVPKPSPFANRVIESIHAAEQVKIDVERALAEAFGEPVTAGEKPAAATLANTPTAAPQPAGGDVAELPNSGEKLGAGWLEKAVQPTVGSTRPASADQGRPIEVEASKLGPAWASSINRECTDD